MAQLRARSPVRIKPFNLRLDFSNLLLKLVPRRFLFVLPFFFGASMRRYESDHRHDIIDELGRGFESTVSPA